MNNMKVRLRQDDIDLLMRPVRGGPVVLQSLIRRWQSEVQQSDLTLRVSAEDIRLALKLLLTYGER